MNVVIVCDIEFTDLLGRQPQIIKHSRYVYNIYDIGLCIVFSFFIEIKFEGFDDEIYLQYTEFTKMFSRKKPRSADQICSKSYRVEDHIRQSFDELALLYAEMKPFDKVYDEDLLDCKYQQREIIWQEIKKLKSIYPLVEEALDKLLAFEELLENIDNDIELLTTTRMIEYSKWKMHYLSVCDKVNEVQRRIKSLMQLERNMNKVSK